jgi:hypothetical protein
MLYDIMSEGKIIMRKEARSPQEVVRFMRTKYPEIKYKLVLEKEDKQQEETTQIGRGGIPLAKALGIRG